MYGLGGGFNLSTTTAANNAFKRAAYGIIDYYLEEEEGLRKDSDVYGWDPASLDNRVDKLWGEVSLFNTYQMFVQLSSKKVKNPTIALKRLKDSGELDPMNPEHRKLIKDVEEKSFLWNYKSEIDLLSLYFAATEALPINSIRQRVMDANNSLKAVGGSDKTISSIYGIAVTAMNFFTDPTISTLTSGTLSQNVDLAGMSFPRCLGVRFHSIYLEKYKLMGMQCVWEVYTDDTFTEKLVQGDDFYHEDLVSREGWAKFYFGGILPNMKSYMKLTINNPNTGMLLDEFYFSFKKNYAVSLSGESYVKERVTGEKIIKDGVLVELQKKKMRNKRTGEVVEKFVPFKSRFKSKSVKGVSEGNPHLEDIDTSVFISTITRYSEKPKMVFMVTPPHLSKYAKLLLILIKQMVDLNFEQAYVTKSNQKPLMACKFLLDELGNLVSDGHGIPNFDTMLSIGLGQDQYFTLILQTLQQLRNAYGENLDKVIQGNVNNIMFLKSNDDAMIKTLETMSGTQHKVYKDSKTVTQDLDKLVNPIDGKVSYSMTVREEPVIKYNDMAFIDPRNSILFRAGDAPIWNRNEMILPMSWRLYKNQISIPGMDMSLQSVPTTSTVMEFDVRKNQPDFNKMLEKRVLQATKVKEAIQIYKDTHGYDDYAIAQLDPDVYARDIMDIIDSLIRLDVLGDENAGYAEHEEKINFNAINKKDVEVNTEFLEEKAKNERELNKRSKKIFAGGMISKEDLVSKVSGVTGYYDQDIIRAYIACRNYMNRDTDNFMYIENKGLYSADGRKPYILEVDVSKDFKSLQEASHDPDSTVYAEEDLDPELLETSKEVTDEFYEFLVSRDSWDFADGEFEREMTDILKNK